MPWKKKYSERKSPRLKGWDYRTPAWYFVTICTKDRQHFFGEIQNKIMGLSQIGNMAYQNWAAIPKHFDHAALGEFIVMPNHVHGLIRIMDWPVKKGRSKLGCEISRPNRMKVSRPDSENGRSFGPLKSGSLSAIIQAYKSSVTRWARKRNNYEFGWQGRFHDHIVRNDREKERIQYYIRNNPRAWDEDSFF